MATRLSEAHFLLFGWTTALWGSPIVLVDSAHGLEESPGSAAETAPWTPPPIGERAPDLQAENEEVTQQNESLSQHSHRRRRLHAAFGEDM